MIHFIFRPIRSMFKHFRRLSLKLKLLVLVALIILITSVYYFTTQHSKNQYELAPATLSSITEIVSETGNITSAGITPIYSTTTGLIEAVYVQNGEQVSKNQTLFKVTATATKQEKDAALSNYLAAKTSLETAQANQLSLQASMFGAWDSFKDLAESDDYENDDGSPRYLERAVAEYHVSEKEWLAAEAAYKKQQVAISQAQANLSATWQAYQATQDSEVKAVLDGQVVNLGIGVGDTVVVPTVATLSSISPALLLRHSHVSPTIKLQVSETDAIKIQPGQTALVQLDALPGKTFAAHVDRVDLVAAPSENVVNYSIYVVMDETSDMIRSGLTADVDITVVNKDNVLIVPSSAVKPHQGGRAVRVLDASGEVEYLPVETGARGDGVTEITSGLEPGTQVIVALNNDQVKTKSSSLF